MKQRKDDISYQELTCRMSELNKLTGLENESNTRLRAIDTILFDVLFWEKSDIETEKYCRSSGYADYVLLINNQPAAVIEAKKAGIDFLLPDRFFENRPYALGLLAKECPSVGSSLQQVIGYASFLGAQYVCISNGHQWLFTLTFVHGQPLEQRLVFVFESLDAIQSKFASFYSCLSQYGIERNIVLKDLLDTLKQPAPSKLSSRIPGYPIPASRNIFQNELSYILDFVWQLMAQEEGSVAFVNQCYVNPNSHEDIIALVQNLIHKRRAEDDILAGFEIQSIDKLPHEIAHLPAERPFVLLGEVGRGKTSFLKYLRFIAAKNYLANYIQIELNFIDRPDNESEIPGFVYSEIERQLRENYQTDVYENKFVRGVLHGDLQRLKRTPKGSLYIENLEKYREFELEEIEKTISDKHMYLTKVFHHLKKGRKQSVALFFDNLDRRPPVLQEQAFLKASAIARDWASLVFICLRPDTYYKSQRSGVLDTIAPTSFTVGQPDLSLVLKKRFAYAKEIAEGNKARKTIQEDISLHLPQVAKLLESCEFAAWKRHGIIPTLEAVSNGNIRRLLDLARKILCSGHLDTKKILERITDGGRYYIPDWEGVKSLLYGDYMHFDPTRSPFINLFDIKTADPAEHFLRLGILHYLSKIPPDRGNMGYIAAEDLLRYLTSIGYSYASVIEVLKIMVDKQYIRRPVEGSIDTLEKDTIRITDLGRFHLFTLIGVFQYLDSAIIDTPILDASIRNKITDTSEISERLYRTELFINYLNDCSKHIAETELFDTWKSVYNESCKNIEEIKMKLLAPSESV